MKLNFTELGWSEYQYWQTQDKKTLKRINKLLNDIQRNGFDGIGNPEPLKNNYSGYWSRRIDETNRIIYTIDEDGATIYRCQGHYD